MYTRLPLLHQLISIRYSIAASLSPGHRPSAAAQDKSILKSWVVQTSVFFFSSRRRHTRWTGDWSSDVCSSDLAADRPAALRALDRALADTAVLGVTTNIDFLRFLLADADVAAGRLDTGLLDRRRSEERRVGKEGRARGWQSH